MHTREYLRLDQMEEVLKLGRRQIYRSLERCKIRGNTFFMVPEEIRKMNFEELIDQISIRVDALSPFMEDLHRRSIDEPTHFNPLLDESIDTYNQFSVAISHAAGIYVGDLLHRAFDLPNPPKKPE